MTDQVLAWVDTRLRLGDIPRMADMLQYAKQEKLSVSRKELKALLQVHPTYAFNLDQRRPRKKTQRPILGMALGRLHADIRFFA